MSVEAVSDNDLVKIKLPLEWNGRPGPSAEWVWAITEDGGYRIDNTAFFTEVLYGDLISAEVDDDGALTFKEVVEVGPYYRCHVHFDANRLDKASVSELMRELDELYGAKVEGFFSGIFGFAYDEDNGYGIFEYLCELLDGGLITDFYMDHAE